MNPDLDLTAGRPGPAGVTAGPDRATADPERLPLSYEQEQLWFLEQLSPGQATYNIHLPYRLRGHLEARTLELALTALIAAHPALRARLHASEGTPYQLIWAPEPANLEVTDLSELPEPERDRRLDDLLRAELATPFDLDGGKLYRFRLIQVSAQDHVLSLGFHHVVTDGWSSGLLLSDLTRLYRELLAGRPALVPAPEGSYSEHVQAQRGRLAGPELEQELAYWGERLAGLPVLELPADRQRPVTASNRGDQLFQPLPAELVAGVRRMGLDQGATLFTVLTAAVAIVLSRYTGQDEIPLGMAIPGRSDPDLEAVVGLFINMAVLRADLTSDPTFTELVARISDASLDVYDHQDVPFNLVVERVQPVRDPSRNPLFQVGVQVLGQELTGRGFELPLLKVEALTFPSTYSRFDLAVNFLDSPAGIEVAVEYATDLFDRWRIEGLIEHIETVLAAAVADPQRRLSQLSLLTPAARQELLAAGRGEPADYSQAPVHVDIAAVAAQRPDAVAAVCRGVELTYGELDRRADRLARELLTRGTGHQDVVGILLDRDLDALIAILGVLKADAAFAMLDPEHPAARLEYILGDTSAATVITRPALLERLPGSDRWSPLVLDPGSDQGSDPGPDQPPLPGRATRDSLAYVIYTSGSTGRPKGVLIEHRALTCFTEAYRRTFDFTPADRLLQLPALTFDMSQGEIFTALRVGATLVLVAPEEGRSPDGIGGLIRDQKVSYAGLSPAILSVVEAGPYPELRAVMGGAEALPAEMVNKWNLPGRRFVNLYGPTEAAIACTEYECEQIEWRSSPPIGHPELNRQVYVVDRWGDLVPRGVPGELLIGGEEGLARGYLNQPEATSEKFVTDPFRPGGRVYRSGDLVRWTAGGELDFLGRLDNQVKLRGLRIELGEIESALLSHPGVRMALVLLTTDGRGEKRLTAYWTATGTPPSSQELGRYLGDQLPEYMVPSSWVWLEEFPLTTARKIDRAALPVPADVEVTQEFVPPSSATEQAVAEIFAIVLGLPQVSAESNFFELGGNSLQAMRVVGRISKSLSIKVSIRLLYGSSTVAEIAATIDGLLERRTRVD